MQIRGTIETSPTIGLKGWSKQPTARYGLYVRSLAKHHSQHVNPSARIRAHAYAIARFWKDNLTNAQRANWTTEAATHAVQKESGRSIFLNGYTLFARESHARLTTGQGIRATVGGSSPPPPFAITDLTQVAGPILQVFFRQTDPWLTQPQAWAVLFDHGLLNVANATGQRRGVIAAILPGLPGTGYPLGALVFRPFTTGDQRQAILSGYSINN